MILKRVKLPKRPMGLYESTVMDTSERAIPWYYPAAVALLIAVVFGAWWSVNRVHAQLSGQLDTGQPEAAAPQAAKNGAGATVAAAPQAAPPAVTRNSDYVAWVTPRVAGQPWTAPAYDSLTVPTNQPPRVYCMASGDGLDANGEHQIGRCGCKTEQGTTFVMDQEQCRLVALNGQYEPFLDTNQAEARRMNDLQQSAHYQQESRRIRETAGGAVMQHVERASGTFPESKQHESSTFLTTSTAPNLL